ncbi:MAG: c-type cytochrome biogenesis protein CcmI [Arenicellales bacterium]|nr:c-type cytochrome biogenesis protein CcmI [Arenicellales bacterium]
MVLFFIIAGMMAIAAVAVVAFPLVRRYSALTGQRDRQNIVIARERLNELEAQVEAGFVTPAQAAQEKSDIELALLEDLATDAGNEPTAVNKRHGIWAGVTIVVLVPLVAGVLYLSLGQPAALDPNQFTQAKANADHSSVDVAAMVRNLEQRLATSPNEIEGWYVLGNSYMTLNQFDKAAAVFKKLRELVGDEPDLFVREADALAMKNGGRLEGEPERLVLKALELKPDHPVALWLAGIAAHRRGDLKNALDYWQRAEPLFNEGSQTQAELQGLIKRARRQLEQTDSSVSAQNTDREAQGQRKGLVKLTVSLDESLKDQVAGEDTLFILARAFDGPPIPLAVVRRQARDLPLTLALDDDMAMVPEMNLSKFDQVVVVAKISKSGDASTKSGDLIGQVSPVSPGQDTLVNVVISERVP